MGQLKDMIEAGKSQTEVSAYLDSLSHDDRLKEIGTLCGNGIQKKLFQLATANITVNDLIPRDGKPLGEVIFYGKNTLPVFSNFQKRMCRSQDGSILWGYNYQTLRPITGPGYFVVADKTDRPGEVMIDYTELPQGTPPQDWPQIKSNTSGISSLVYGNMKDFLRRVSKNVFIGEATKKGKSMNQFFILCRP